ncbi:MAG: hypothetical protein MR877_03220 [Spirochaetia bacterium]|nr:hypothetical protein [Spirochaetia bacterium]
MYHYVESKDYKPYHFFISDKLNRVKQQILKEHQIEKTVDSVGSLYKKLVTQNNNLPFDLDYNLVIENRLITQLNPKPLKDYVMEHLDDMIAEKCEDWKYCQDSKAAITIRRVVNGRLDFSADIAILAKNSNGQYCRLLHDKQRQKYDWAPVPNSEKVYERFRKLKNYGYWEDIRELYLKKKNHYLSIQDKEHPSFVVFVETIKEVWDKACK